MNKVPSIEDMPSKYGAVSIFTWGFEYALNCWEHLLYRKGVRKAKINTETARRLALRSFLMEMLLTYWEENHAIGQMDFPEIENCELEYDEYNGPRWSMKKGMDNV